MLLVLKFSLILIYETILLIFFFLNSKTISIFRVIYKILMHISILHSLIYVSTILKRISVLISQASNFYKKNIYTYQITTRKEKKNSMKVWIYNRIKIIIFNCACSFQFIEIALSYRTI